MNFMYFIRLSTSSFIKLDFIVDDVDSDISYGLIKITSSSVLYLCIVLVFPGYCHPHIDFLVYYMCPICHPIFFEFDTPDLPYCFG